MRNISKIAKYLGMLAVATLAVFVGMSLFSADAAFAHCDGLDGPVVNAARMALQTGDLSRVLIWVRPDDASEIKRAFEEALAVRKLGPAAQTLADFHFFETLVRVHRAGEGAPYTGLKPAGRDLGPAIPAADKAVETGAIEPVVALLTEAVRHGIHERFHAVRHAQGFAPNDLAAGREYIAAYVEFIHYIERLYEDATGRAEGHYEEAHEAPTHAHVHAH